MLHDNRLELKFVVLSVGRIMALCLALSWALLGSMPTCLAMMPQENEVDDSQARTVFKSIGNQMQQSLDGVEFKAKFSFRSGWADSVDAVLDDAYFDSQIGENLDRAEGRFLLGREAKLIEFKVVSPRDLSLTSLSDYTAVVSKSFSILYSPESKISPTETRTARLFIESPTGNSRCEHEKLNPLVFSGVLGDNELIRVASDPAYHCQVDDGETPNTLVLIAKGQFEEPHTTTFYFDTSGKFRTLMRITFSINGKESSSVCFEQHAVAPNGARIPQRMTRIFDFGSTETHPRFVTREWVFHDIFFEPIPHDDWSFKRRKPTDEILGYQDKDLQEINILDLDPAKILATPVVNQRGKN